MAKKAAKETSMPLVFALVFFVLTTVAFGVMWYMQYSDQQAKADEVAKAKKEVSAANAVAKEAELNLKLLKVFVGVDEADDKTSMIAEHKAGDKMSAELKRVNAALAKKLGVADASALPVNLQTWSVDAAGQIDKDGPSKGLVELVAGAISDRDAAKADAEKAMSNFNSAVAEMKKAADALAAAKKEFDAVAASLPKGFDTKLQAEIDKFDKRVKQFVAAEASSRKEIDEKSEEIGRLERDKKRLESNIGSLQEQVQAQIAQLAKTQNNTFQYDQPQGKILRRPEPGVVEINIGSNDLVRPGLTFTVLPYDFQEKGRQSRMRVQRVQDERGKFQNVERFVEKATIEVIEVVGPNLSRCRITQEFDPIRDGAAAGDLIYNSVWRKGAADHIALIGIFDVNGDGSDDIESVVRDLTKMGIPVDAYFSMKDRKWVGQITEQTRFIIEGWYPANSATDPNRDDKTKLIAAMSDAVKVGRDKGVATVGFRDFFPRMGYRVKIDLPLDKLNQATAPYLNRVAAVEPPPGMGN